jgi:hypothetical protein
MQLRRDWKEREEKKRKNDLLNFRERKVGSC